MFEVLIVEIVEITTKERMAKDGSFVFKIAPPPPLPEASTKKPSAITFASGFAFWGKTYWSTRYRPVDWPMRNTRF